MKGIFAMICTLFLLIFITTPALAFLDVENQALSDVLSLYSEYYYISDATAHIIQSKENSDGSMTYTVDISFKRTLKEKSAYEMPYIQGLIEAKEKLTDAQEISRAEDYIEIWVTELENYYIGVPQDTNVTVSVTVPVQSAAQIYRNGATEAKMCVYDEVLEEEYPLESLRPRSDAESKQSGTDAIAKIVEREMIFEQIAQVNSLEDEPTLPPIQCYDRVKARDYAREWSCDSGSSVRHASCHNTKYLFIDNNDCANFVSQCIAEGGLKTDDTWNSSSGNTAWYTTGNNNYGLRDYMVDMGYFFHSTDDYDAFAGSIINQLDSNGNNKGHIGLVDQNDTRTMTFCSHTACRKSKAFSWFTYRDFYVPVWDSETDNWT